MRGKLSARTLLAVVVVVAAVLAAVLIALSAGGGKESKPQAVSGTAEVARLLRGIPQRGNVLGRPEAPLTLVEYAEPQCPFCGMWARNVFPAIVRRYVRAGKAKLVFRGLIFIEPRADSERALRAAAAAGRQGRLWHVIDILYRNQGEEGTGWIREELVRDILESIPGLDAERALDEGGDEKTTRTLAAWEEQAARDGVSGTPTFLLGRSGGQLAPMALPSAQALSDPQFFSSAFERLLRP